MSIAALLTLLVYVLIICLLAYVVVFLFGKAGMNGTVRMIVYVIAGIIILVLLLNTIGVVRIGDPLIP